MKRILLIVFVAINVILAEETNRWGKPLDPTTFWKGRVLWLDSSAQDAAERHGRQFPPMPYNDNRFAGYSEQDRVLTSGVEGPDLHLRVNSKENAFWDWFGKTHPRPPEQLDFKQTEVAHDLFATKNIIGVPSQDIASLRVSITNNVAQMNYPPEAFTEKALFWCYVINQRREYQKLLDAGNSAESISMRNFFRRLQVDPKYVTKSLSNEEVKGANAWKMTYLRRLRREKVDESYINAYLKAWDLPATQLTETNSVP